MKTFREHLQGFVLDIVSNTVYIAEQGLVPTGSRQLYYMLNRKPHSQSPSFNVFWNRVLGTLPLTQECVKMAQTSQRKQSNDCSMLTRLRKGYLNSLLMRKRNGLKEKQYGKN